MEEFEFRIKSREEFILDLRRSIDNEKYIFSLPKKKYAGYYNDKEFRLSENSIKYRYFSFYRILGKIEDDKVKIRLEPSNSSYFLLMFYGLMFVLFFLALLVTKETWIFSSVQILLILKSWLVIKQYYKRKDLLIKDFEGITEGMKTPEKDDINAQPNSLAS